MKKLFATLVGAGVLLAASAPSFATPMLRLTSDGSTVTVSDNLSGDAVPLAGQVTYIGSVGSFVANVTTGTTKPLIGDASQAAFDLNSINVTSGTAGSLKLEFTETDFISSYDIVGFVSQIGGTINNLPGSSLAYTVYVDTSNTAFGTGTEVYSATFGSGAFSAASFNQVGLGLSTPYSITIVANLTHSGSGSSSFDALVQVPEPATVALFGAGLLAIGGLRGRRRKEHQDTVA